MTRPMRHLALALLAWLAPSCSQPPGATGGSSGQPATTPSVAIVTAPAPAAGSPVAAAGDRGWDPPDYSVPKEKFSDGARNFEAAKKALLEGYYSDSLTEDDLYRAAVAGMLERADPRMRRWNRLLSPSDVRELRLDLQGELVGVGVVFDFDPKTGYVAVRGTIPGSPAERAGIAPPDTIVTVDGKLYKGAAERDVVAAIRGKEGEPVTLTILRGDKLVTVPLVREKIVYDTVTDLALPGGVGYVRIPGFNHRTAAGLHDALGDLASKRVSALVVDLRDDMGGSFDDAVAAAGELVPAGSAVAGLEKRGKTEPVTPRTTPMLLDLPVAVLVDGETASSAECLAGALQELRHATVVGSRTHGKWTVQVLEDLPNGYAVKYTTAVFRTPGGKSYDGTGLPPDVEVDATAEDVARALQESDPARRVAADVQLRTALRVLARRP